MVTGYCVRCKAKGREMEGAHQDNSGKRAMIRGTCKECKTNMVKFGTL